MITFDSYFTPVSILLKTVHPEEYRKKLFFSICAFLDSASVTDLGPYATGLLSWSNTLPKPD